MSPRRLAFSALVAGALAAGIPLAAQDADPKLAVEFSAAELRRIATHTGLALPPADETNAYQNDPAAARLGHRLFYDTRLSGDGERSCATCHDPLLGFSDGVSLHPSLGSDGFLKRNSPSLWNVAHNRWFYWDGRVDTLWSQALKPTEDPKEMAGDRTATVRLIASDPALRADYEVAFGPLPAVQDLPEHARPAPGTPDHPLAVAWAGMSAPERSVIDRTFANYGKALAAFQSKLVSRNSRFDTFAAGLANGDPEQLAALTAAEQRGLATFIGKGRCRMCHAGPNFSDGEFHGTGVAPLFEQDLWDAGRYDGIKQLLADPFNSMSEFSDDREGPRAQQVRTLRRGPESWGEFKTPSLRNVAQTGPYMHEGQFARLEDVVRFYSTLEGSAPPGHHQEQVLQPLNLTDAEQADLVAFLKALSDEDIDPALKAPIAD